MRSPGFTATAALHRPSRGQYRHDRVAAATGSIVAAKEGCVGRCVANCHPTETNCLGLCLYVCEGIHAAPNEMLMR